MSVHASSLSTDHELTTPNNPTLQVPEIPKSAAVDLDFDLDSLLSDLTSFDPSTAVAASHPAPPTQPVAAAPPTPVRLEPVRSGPPSTQSTPQHGRFQPVIVEPSPTPPPSTPGTTPSTPGTTPSHVPLRSNTQVDKNYQPRGSVDQPEPIPRAYSEGKFIDAKSSPDHKRPAGKPYIYRDSLVLIMEMDT